MNVSATLIHSVSNIFLEFNAVTAVLQLSRIATAHNFRYFCARRERGRLLERASQTSLPNHACLFKRLVTEIVDHGNN